jgi:hypothetical protein
MEKKIVNDLHNLNGKNGEITIHHDWYGNQKIRGIFHIIDDGERIGVKLKDNEIFLWNNEITNIEVSGNCAMIKGESMQIKIEI